MGTLLWAAGHAINICTLLAAVVYLFGTVVWMHAPLFAVLATAAPMALLPLGLAWLCRRIGRHLRDDAPVLTATPVKRWLLGIAGIVVAGAVAAMIQTGMRDSGCRADQVGHADGYERVCERDLARWDVTFLPNLIAMRNLAFTPVDLTRTPFARFESLGSRAETVVDVRSRLYRGFRMPDGHRVTLFENDMSADGTTSWRETKDEPERINGLPARLVVVEAPSGKAVSLLSWTEERRDYQLWIDANIARMPLREQLFALAASIPKAVPACPKEPPPKKARLGADGLPVDDPMPRVLTEAQLDTLLAKHRRLCK